MCFWHIQTVFKLILESLGSKKSNFKENSIQTRFGGVLKCDSIHIYTVASPSGSCGHSNQISNCLLCHSQQDTQLQRQIRIDGSEPERLSRIHAAPLSLSGQTEEFCSATWQHNCVKGEMMHLRFSFYNFKNSQTHHWCFQRSTICWWLLPNMPGTSSVWGHLNTNPFITQFPN